MGIPKGFPKCFDFAGCVTVSIVLRDYQVITGRIIGFIDDNGQRKDKYDFDKNYKDHKDSKDHKDDCKDHHKDDKGKHDDKCCKPKVDVNVEIEEECKFILVELSRPVAAVNLSSVSCNLLPFFDLVVSGTTFPVDTCVAVNVDNILYIGTGATFCDFPISIGPDAANGALSITAKK